MDSFPMSVANNLCDKLLPKYLDSKTVLIYCPHPVHLSLILYPAPYPSLFCPYIWSPTLNLTYMLSPTLYKKVSDFPLPSRDVTKQTLPGAEKLN